MLDEWDILLPNLIREIVELRFGARAVYRETEIILPHPDQLVVFHHADRLRQEEIHSLDAGPSRDLHLAKEEVDIFAMMHDRHALHEVIERLGEPYLPFSL